MPFISSITRRKENAGITLKAKLISPNRPNLMPRKSRILKYKIRIKAKTLSDYECCVIDNSYLSSRISDTNSLAGLKTSLNNLQSTAAYDTYTTYSIIPLEDNGNIRSFLKDDGTLEGRPKLGESNSDGYIVIKTSKNAESVTTKLPVTIESYSAQEIINDTSLYEIGDIWNRIRGRNPSGPYNDGSELNGYNNIMYDIDFSGLSSADLFSSKVATNSENIQILYDIDVIEANDDRLINNLNQRVLTIEKSGDTGIVHRPSYAMCVSNFKNLYVNLAGQIKSEYDTTENKILEPVNGSNSTDGMVSGSIRFKIMGSTQFNRICFRKKGIKIKVTPRIRMNNTDYTPTNGGPIINCGVLSEFFDMAGSEDCMNFINSLVDRYTIRWYSNINDVSVVPDNYHFDTGTITIDDGSTPAVSGSISTLNIDTSSTSNYGMLEIAQSPFLDSTIIAEEGDLFKDYIIGYGDNQFKSRVGGVNLSSITAEAFIRKKDDLSAKLDAGTVDNIFFGVQIDGTDNPFYDASDAGSLPSVFETVPGWQPEQRGVQRIKVKYSNIPSTAPIEFAILFKFTIRSSAFVKSNDNPLSTFTNNVEQTIYKAKAFKLTLV